jgi:hypothetical protein
MNVRLKRGLYATGAVLFLATAFGIYDAGLHEIAAPPNDTNITAPHGGDAVGERVDARSWKLRYDRMVSNADQSVVDLYGVHDATIYQKGKPYLRVRAAHLTINTITRDFTAFGPFHVVTITSKPPRSFTTDSATWSDATQKLSFIHRTTITTGADAPMVVGSMVMDVRTGDVDATDAAGGIRLK